MYYWNHQAGPHYHKYGGEKTGWTQVSALLYVRVTLKPLSIGREGFQSSCDWLIEKARFYYDKVQRTTSRLHDFTTYDFMTFTTLRLLIDLETGFTVQKWVSRSIKSRKVVKVVKSCLDYIALCSPIARQELSRTFQNDVAVTLCIRPAVHFTRGSHSLHKTRSTLHTWQSLSA